MKLESVIATVPDHTNDAIVITTAEPIRQNGPEIVWVNKAFTTMTGYTPEDVIGQTPRVLQGPDLDQDARARIYEALRTWKPVREILKNYTKAGKPFWVELNIKPVADDKGWFHYWVAVQRDVTEQVAQTEALRLAMEEARGAEQAQSMFLSTMSHEIRTPLNGVLGTAQILPMLGELNDTQKAAVNAMMEAGNILLKLIEDILDLSKVKAGVSPVRLTTVDPAVVIRNAVIAVRAMAERKSLEILTSIPSDAAQPIVSDERRLLQILVNLLGNAVKFTETGQIAVSARRLDQGKIAFNVKDSGPGIAPDMQERIFEPFRQVADGMTRQHEGAGLGLAICREFAEALEGTLTLESTLGQGSSFTLTVPVNNRADALQSAAGGMASEATASPEAIGTVLIIEDNALNRSIVEQAFRYKGWTVVSMERGAGVVDIVRQHQPDVVILDRHLPDKSGDEVIITLRSSGEGFSQLPIIMLTADARTEAEADTRALGASRFFSKPVDVEMLVRAAEQVLAEKA
ncbi:MAG: ATP-binding protein [Rhodobacteraceae bacterium]|nr:ATP-binding protein [Paracoccaceae bacterium]